MSPRVPSPLRPAAASLLSLLLLASACSSQPSGDADAGADAGFTGPTPVAVPVLTPCPAGWREVPAADGPTTCDPWPATIQDCGIDSAWLPGDPGCTPLGTPCPSGDWADGLPSSGVLYVRAGAPVGASGTRSAPFATIAEAMTAASAGTVIAVSKGTFDEVVQLRAGVTLWGACIAETLITSSSLAISGVINAAGQGGTVKNLRVSGARAGIFANSSGNSLRLDSVAIDGATGIGAIAGNRAEITGTNVAVRRTQPKPGSNNFGRGLDCEFGGKITLARAAIESNLENGANVSGAGSRLELTDSVIRGTQVRLSDLRMGRGVSVITGGSARLSRVVLEDNHEIGLFLSGSASATLEDCIVRGTQPSTAEGDTGDGVVVEIQSMLQATRFIVAANHFSGLAIYDGGSRVTLTDAVIRDTAGAASTGEQGTGIAALAGARAQLSRVALLRNRNVGLVVSDSGTILDAADLSIRDTASQQSDGMWGRGLHVQSGARLTARGLSVSGSRDVGVFAYGAGTGLALEDVTVTRTVLSDCIARGSCPNAGGSGVVSAGNAAVAIARFRLAGHAQCGIELGEGGVADLSDGEVTDNPIGACVLTDGFDVNRLRSQVRYANNGKDLDASAMPLPDAAIPRPRAP